MKKTLFYLLLGAFLCPIFTSCNDETPIITPETVNDTTDQTPSNSELLMKKWLVDEAYVDGTTPDISSKGLSVEFKSNNVYTLFLKNGSTTDGTWAFAENETKIDLDKGQQLHQTWTIEELNETKLDVTFISPFTGQNAQWIMK